LRCSRLLELELELELEPEPELELEPEVEVAGVLELEGVMEHPLEGVPEQGEEEEGEVGCARPTWLRPNIGRTRGPLGLYTNLPAWRRCSPPETRQCSWSGVTEVSCWLR
jgi:hypothetical protein